MVDYGACISGRAADLFKQQVANAAQFFGIHSGHEDSNHGLVFKELTTCALLRRPTRCLPARRTRVDRR